MKAPLLGVNIDHIATVRNARGTRFPDPIEAALIAEAAGAAGITLHLREDRRHIVDRDVFLLNDILQTRMNLEIAVTEEMVEIARRIVPTYCCLVPEKREERTTEGGLDVVGQYDRVATAVSQLREKNIKVSLFIEPDTLQIEAARDTGAELIEIHTGHYADALSQEEALRHLSAIEDAAHYAYNLGLVVNAGHGLNYHNVQPVAAIEVFYELNIGHAIIARSLFSGLDKAVRDMVALLKEARR